MSIHYYLLSKGRVGRQKTLSYFPEDVKKNHLTFVTPKPEIAEHRKHEYSKGIDFFGVDPNMLIGDKFLHVAKHHVKQGGRNFVLVDDDAALKLFNPETEKFSSTRKCDQGDVSRYLLKTFPKILKTHQAAGLGSLSRFSTIDWLKENKFCRLNRKVCCISGYDAEFIIPLVDNPQLSGLWCQDTNWNLEILLNGGSTYSDFKMVWESNLDPVTNPGGCNLYRTPESVNVSFLRIMLHYPGLISRGPMKVHAHSFLRIDWKPFDSPGYSVEKGFREGALIFRGELAFQKKTVQDFLAAVPKASVPWYKKRMKEMGLDKERRGLFQ